MGSDLEKIRTLLDYWIEHNKEHGQEFTEWAEKMKDADKPIVSAELLQASLDMDKATEHLFKAREKL
ncbi:MAG TPA: hypothetical protein G4O15_07570 [Dehalococcoidia bacterium]|nr:hypothetical protein [Dehalococcoidia bacterium]